MTYCGPNETVLIHMLQRVPPTGREATFSALLEATAWIPGNHASDGFHCYFTADNEVPALTHPGLASLCQLSADVKFHWMPFRELFRLAREKDYAGVHINPSVFGWPLNRFAVDLLADGIIPFSDAAALCEDVLIETGVILDSIPERVVNGFRAAAFAAGVHEVRLGRLSFEWQGDLPCLYYSPYPTPQFEVLVAGIWRDAGNEPTRLRSRPLEEAEGIPSLYPTQRDSVGAPDGQAFFPPEIPLLAEAYPGGLPDALTEDLAKAAGEMGVQQLIAFGIQIGDLPPQLALAYLPFPHDEFAEKYTELHRKHRIGWVNVPLVSIHQFGEPTLREHGLVIYEDGQQSLF